MNYESIIKPPKSERLKSGRVTLKPGEDVGKHVTENKEELLIVLQGKATVTEGEKKTVVKAGTTHFIPRDQEHNVRNEEKSDLTYVYVVSLL